MEINTTVLIVNTLIILSAIICGFSGYKKGFILTLFDLFGLIFSFVIAIILVPVISDNITLVKAATSDSIVNQFLMSIANLVIWFVIVFVILAIVIKIIGKLINKIFKLPGLSLLNKTLGLILGLFSSVFYILIISLIVTSPLIKDGDVVFNKSFLSPIDRQADGFYDYVVEKSLTSGIFDEMILKFQESENEKYDIQDIIQILKQYNN